MCNFYTYPNTDALVSCLSSKTSLVCIPDKAIVIWQALKQQVKPQKKIFLFPKQSTKNSLQQNHTKNCDFEYFGIQLL